MTVRMAPQRFLYPRQRQIEVLSAIYAGGFGLYCEALTTAGERSPIYWVSDSLAVQHGIAVALLVAALIHAGGIRINGAWRGSPALRAFAMAVHTVVFLILATAAPGSSAAYSYAWVMAFAAAGMINAARDCATAMGWRGWMLE